MGMLFRIMRETRLKNVAVPARLELATFGLGNRCSIRLSYGTNSTARAERWRLRYIASAGRPEPAPSATPALPSLIRLSLRRSCFLRYSHSFRLPGAEV